MINPQIMTNTPAAPRSDNAAPAAKAGTATDQFGTVLAKKMEDKPAQKTADKSKPADPSNAGNQDTPAATPTPDPASLASMMFGIAKPAITPQPGLKEQDKAQLPSSGSPTVLPTDAAAMVAGMVGAQPQAQVQAPAGTAMPAKSAHVAIGAASPKTAPGAAHELPSVAAPKADVALQANPKLGAEMFRQAELQAPVNTPSEQALAQSASTLVATSLPPDRAANPTGNTTISAPVGSSAWPAEFAQKVNWVSTQQNQTAELHLNPPDLGPMTVVLSVSDNQATAVFSSPHSAVRDAIENAMPRLRESMAENGISLGNTSVNDQAPRDPGFANQRSGSTRSAGTGDADSGAAPVASLPTMPTRRHNGMLDTFA